MRLSYISYLFTAAALGCALGGGLILIMENHVLSGIVLFAISLIASILNVIKLWR